jgi:hypothetical protein
MTEFYYYCKKCEWHRSDSKIGKEHLEYIDEDYHQKLNEKIKKEIKGN